jgi:hypothetical protein
MREPLAFALVVALLASACGGNEESGDARRARANDGAASAFRLEGWKTDFGRRVVALGEFRSGGPPKDGIPSIDDPKFLSVGEVDFLEPREPVIELVTGEEVRGYPIQILIWHEIVNDTVDRTPVAVTFCPLCNTAIAFDRRLDGRVLEFGTTGKLRNADLVMYDRQTESWWQQFGGRALVGTLAGERLRHLPARIVSWREFARAHPGGQVLARPADDFRPYGSNPYEGYDDASRPPFFPVENEDDDRLPPKERVVFVERSGESVAVPFSLLARRRVVRVDLGGQELEIRFRKGVASALGDPTIAEGADVGAAEVLENGRPVPFSEPFWFAVAAFRPDVVLR